MSLNLKSFSFSSISGFENCPKSFELRYVKKIPEAFQSVEAFMGSTVHLVLEKIYRDRSSGKETASEVLTDIYRDLWDGSDKSRVKVVKEDKSMQHYLDLGMDLVTSYFENIFLSDKSETLMLEHKFSLELTGGVAYRGIIDRVSRNEKGILRVTDFKTGSVGDPKETLQLPSYSIFIFENNMENEIEICYEDLKRSETKVTGIRRDDINEIRLRIEEKIEKIRNSSDFPARPSALCKWCGYNEICDEYISFTGGETKGENYCPQCGSILVERKGKFGRFLGCSNYPQCRYTFDLGKKREELSGDMICPECGSPLRERKGRFGKFLGCSNYPECRFTRKIQ